MQPNSQHVLYGWVINERANMYVRYLTYLHRTAAVSTPAVEALRTVFKLFSEARTYLMACVTSLNSNRQGAAEKQKDDTMTSRLISCTNRC